MMEAEILINNNWLSVKIINIQYLENNIDYDYIIIYMDIQNNNIGKYLTNSLNDIYML